MMKKIILSGVLLISLDTFAAANCSAKLESSSVFLTGKNSPKPYLIKKLRMDAVNKFERKDRGVRISEFSDRFEVILVDGKDSMLGKTVVTGLPRNKAFKITLDIPVKTESEILEVSCF
jgi:hypothetical protein